MDAMSIIRELNVGHARRSSCLIKNIPLFMDRIACVSYLFATLLHEVVYPDSCLNHRSHRMYLRGFIGGN